MLSLSTLLHNIEVRKSWSFAVMDGPWEPAGVLKKFVGEHACSAYLDPVGTERSPWIENILMPLADQRFFLWAWEVNSTRG
jgi:hypothetical protein